MSSSQNTVTSDSITVTTTGVAALALLSESDGKINGRQRFQKLTFLLDEHLGDRASLYSYSKYDYGPYAKQLNRDLDELEKKSLIIIRTKSTYGGGKRYKYRLSSTGEDVMERLLETNEAVSELVEAVQTIVSEHGDTPISNLIKQVHEDNPEYWENSVYWP